VKGVYRDPVTGKTVFDESRRYTVALSRRRLPALRRLLRDVAVEFAQEEIYLVISGTVELIKRGKGRKEYGTDLQKSSRHSLRP
jgi:hypothetical protein